MKKKVPDFKRRVHLRWEGVEDGQPFIAAVYDTEVDDNELVATYELIEVGKMTVRREIVPWKK